MSLFNTISPKDADWGDKVARFRRQRIDRFILHPTMWEEAAVSPTLQSLKWIRVRFDASGIAKIPDDRQGIYSFFAESDAANHSAVKYLLYVGLAKDQGLRSRVRSYLNERTKKKPRVHIVEMLDRFPRHLWIHYAVVDKGVVASTEDELIAAFLPPFNREFPATVSTMVKAALS